MTSHLYVSHDSAEWFCATSLDGARDVAMTHWSSTCGYDEDDAKELMESIVQVDDDCILEFFDEDEEGKPMTMGTKTALEWVLNQPPGLFFAGEP